MILPLNIAKVHPTDSLESCYKPNKESKRQNLVLLSKRKNNKTEKTIIKRILHIPSEKNISSR